MELLLRCAREGKKSVVHNITCPVAEKSGVSATSAHTAGLKRP